MTTIWLLCSWPFQYNIGIWIMPYKCFKISTLKFHYNVRTSRFKQIKSSLVVFSIFIATLILVFRSSPKKTTPKEPYESFFMVIYWLFMIFPVGVSTCCDFIILFINYWCYYRWSLNWMMYYLFIISTISLHIYCHELVRPFRYLKESD